jgi:anti-sigma factor RsiW
MSVPIPEHCPVDPETAEAYLLGNMPPDEARAFEGHFIACPQCERVVRFVLAINQAARKIRDSEK